MPKKDILNSLIVAFLMGVFLFPVIKTTGVLNAFSQFLVYLFVLVVPVISVAGMYVAYMIGKKIPLLWQFAKFALVGVLNTAIDFGVLNLLISMTGITSGASIIPIKAFAFSSAVLNSYFWNKKWVFAGQGSGNIVVFFIITAIGIAINAFVVFIITTYVPPIIVKDPVLWANVANVASTAISMVWNFLGYKLIVFKK